jgi:hypothetical protein
MGLKDGLEGERQISRKERKAAKRTNPIYFAFFANFARDQFWPLDMITSWIYSKFILCLN